MQKCFKKWLFYGDMVVCRRFSVYRNSQTSSNGSTVFIRDSHLPAKNLHCEVTLWSIHSEEHLRSDPDAIPGVASFLFLKFFNSAWNFAEKLSIFVYFPNHNSELGRFSVLLARSFPAVFGWRAITLVIHKDLVHHA
jgi:hypothetical protein